MTEKQRESVSLEEAFGVTATILRLEREKSEALNRKLERIREILEGPSSYKSQTSQIRAVLNG